MRIVALRLQGLSPEQALALHERVERECGSSVEYNSAGTANRPFDAAITSLAVDALATVISATALFFQLRDRAQRASDRSSPSAQAEQALQAAEELTGRLLEAPVRQAVYDYLSAARPDAKSSHRATIVHQEFVVRLDYEDGILSMEARASASSWMKES